MQIMIELDEATKCISKIGLPQGMNPVEGAKMFLACVGVMLNSIVVDSIPEKKIVVPRLARVQ